MFLEDVSQFRVGMWSPTMREKVKNDVFLLLLDIAIIILLISVPISMPGFNN